MTLVTDEPLACANDRAGVNVIPVPVAPDVPTVLIVTVSGFTPAASTTMFWPALKLVTLPTLMFVALTAAMADSVVEIGVLPALLVWRVHVVPPSVVVTIGASVLGRTCPEGTT